MKCEKYLEIIDDLVEGELNEQTAERVNLHIFACPECASRYEILAQEKKMYAHYLFDTEPSNDLPIKFRAQLKSEANHISNSPQILTGAFSWKANIAELLRFSPALVGLVMLFVFGFGFGLLKLMTEKLASGEKEYSAKTESGGVQFATISQDEIDKDTKINLPAEAKSDDYVVSSPGNKKTEGNRFSNPKSLAVTNVKFTATKPIEVKKHINFANNKKNLTADIRLNKEGQTRRLQLRNLEKETAGQIEKIELLLRSFRNSRMTDGSEVFDVSYEKQQAKKLLEKNVRLRQIAENYGTFYTEEILSQVEPYLLDISHLEINPSPAKVLDIKERVKNQNIIARLQVYY
jgi:hypothetical protein